MPSFQHDILVELFRSRGEIAAELLEACGVGVAYARVELELAAVVLHAVSELAEGPRELYFDVIMTALPAALRHLLETQMIEGYKFQSELARRFFVEARALSKEQGRAQGLREAVLALARIKVEDVGERDVAAIEAVQDQRVLNDLIVGLGRATTSAEAREVLARGYSNSRP